MNNTARGYIASGQFNEQRTPQHLQNQIVKNYCEANNLVYVLSRAEYWFNGSTQCQLWAALNEGFNHIVFFSLWQLPAKQKDRKKIYDHCIDKKIILHFATERLSTDPASVAIVDIEILFKCHLLVSGRTFDHNLDFLSRLA